MHEHLHAAVVLGGAALDQAAVLEAVDDAGHVRVVAAAARAASSLIGRGSSGSSWRSAMTLRRRELELRGDRHEARACRRRTGASMSAQASDGGAAGVRTVATST